jgi:large subunit ribosomal protein L4
MTLDVVNEQNEKVGSVELSDDVFGGPINTGLIWESVVHRNAVDQQGTHSTKTRGRVRGSGHKPWRQKGTGRARVGEVRTPLWRGGGIVFGPQPRSHGYQIPKKVSRGALRAALSQKLKDGTVTIVDDGLVLTLPEPRTRLAADRLAQLGISGGVVVVDVGPDTNMKLAMRNLPRVRVIDSCRLTARDVIGSVRLVISKRAVERLAQVLGS